MNKVIIVGGGAAGMLASVIAARNGCEVLLFEKNEKLGKKVYITGKGRCNVTNNCDPEELLQAVMSNPKFLYSAFYSFTSQDMMHLLEEAGVPLKTERGNRVFPVSDHSSDIIHGLERLMKKYHVQIRLHCEVLEILTENGIASGVKLKDHTVYTIDLLGFGRSEKPNLTYTNYLYVQLLSDFIKSEIGHRTDILATGDAASLAVMACGNSPELFDRLILVNPESMLSCSMVPGKNAKLYKFILDLPIAGTLIYHIASSRQNIADTFKNIYYSNPYSVTARQVDAYYEAAHLGESPKSVYASVKCNYTKCNIINSLKKIDNSIYLLGGADLDDMESTLEEYKTYNPAIESVLIPDTKHLPQLESPAAFYEICETFLGPE